MISVRHGEALVCEVHSINTLMTNGSANVARDAFSLAGERTYFFSKAIIVNKIGDCAQAGRSGPKSDACYIG